MGTLNTSINLQSADSLPFAINQTLKTSGFTGEFVESGVKHITTFSEDFLTTGAGNISNKDCGPNGAFVMVQNPATNKYKVKLYGYQQLSEESNEGELVGMESFATLKPGDSMLVPLTPQQAGIYACTTFGTCSINYYIADRGGEFGESGIFVFTVGTQYYYSIMDAQLAEVLPSGLPSPYIAAAIPDCDSGTWTYNGPRAVVNNKGYVLRFGGGNERNIFINSRGEIVLDQNMSGWDIYNFDNYKGYVITNNDGTLHVKYFDGDELHVYDFFNDGGDWDIWNDWDYTSADGSFILYVRNYNSTGSNINTFFSVGKDGYYVLTSTDENENLYVEDAAVNYYSNFIFLTTYNNNTGYYQRMQIYNTKGVLLQDVDLTVYEYPIDDKSYYMYGSNKVQVVFTDENGYTDYLLNYNGKTNKLIGYDSTLGLITWTHDGYDNSAYNNRLVYAYNKYPTNSIRPYPYTWNSGMFDAESMAIVYTQNFDNQSTYHLNTNTNWYDVLYVLDGDVNHSKYTLADDSPLTIRITNEHENYRTNPSSNLITFTYSPINETATGSLNVLAVTKSGIATSSIIPDLGQVKNDNSDITVKPVGDYMMYNSYNANTDTTTYTMLKSATVKDSVTVAGDARYAGVWRTRNNSLLLRSWYYDSPRNWYFNTATNKFTELTAGGTSFNAAKPYYPQHYWNQSTTTNGLNDGNFLLGPDEGVEVGLEYDGNASLYGYNNNMRMLKKGAVTAND